MQAIALIMIVAVSFICGVFALLGYMLWRIMDNPNMDDSNINNAERILSHVVLHPHDFSKMYYLTDAQIMRLKTTQTAYDDELQRPFWYADKDEFSEVVQTRPR